MDAVGFILNIKNQAAVQRNIERVAKGLPKLIQHCAEDVMDMWKKEAVNIALEDMGTLRRGISVEVEQAGESFNGLIKSVAKERGFDYAYYWHEVKGEAYNPTTPGTVARYLSITMDYHRSEWQGKIEQRIQKYIGTLGR